MNSFSALFGAGGRVSTEEDLCSRSAFSLLSIDSPYTTNLTRWGSSSSMLSMAPISDSSAEETTHVDEQFNIRLTCDDCYLWRKKCREQERKLQQVHSQCDELKLINVELNNETKELNLKTKAMQHQLHNCKATNDELKQQNEDQLHKINDMKFETVVMKQELVTMKQKHEELEGELLHKKNKESELLRVIDVLRQQMDRMRLEMNKVRQHAKVARDIKNPWFCILTMT